MLVLVQFLGLIGVGTSTQAVDSDPLGRSARFWRHAVQGSQLRLVLLAASRPALGRLGGLGPPELLVFSLFEAY